MVGRHNQQGVVELSDGGVVLLSDVDFSVDVAVAVVASAAAAVALPVEVGVAGVAGVAADVSPMFVGCVAVSVVPEDVGVGVFAKSEGLIRDQRVVIRD